jgi:hypothetical protein
MRTIVKCLFYFFIVIATVFLIQNLAILSFLSSTKDIPRLLKQEGVYAKIASFINDSANNSEESVPLPSISPEIVEAVASPIIVSSLSYVLGESKAAPTISLNQILENAKQVDPGLVKQITTYKQQAKGLLTPEMISQLPEEQKAAAVNAKDFLENDKKISLEHYLISPKETIRYMKLSIPIFLVCILILVLITLLISPTWKNKATTMASYCFFLAVTTGLVALFDSVVFTIALQAIGGTGLGEKILQLLVPLVFTLSIRYFQAATIGLGSLFLIFLLARLLLFHQDQPTVVSKKTAAKKK